MFEMFESPFFAIIGQISNIAGAVGGIVSAIGVVKLRAAQRRALEHVEVQLLLEGEDRTVALPLEMLRKDISRAELLGRLSMACRDPSQRYSVRAMSTPAFMRAINEVVEGKSSTLVILCTKEELDQFAVL